LRFVNEDSLQFKCVQVTGMLVLQSLTISAGAGNIVAGNLTIVSGSTLSFVLSIAGSSGSTVTVLIAQFQTVSIS
jgi:hypothetical protein